MRQVWFVPVAAALVVLASCGSGGADEPTPAQQRARAEAAALVQPQDVDVEQLKAEVTDPRARQFYESRQWQPAWTVDTAAGLIESLRGADRHGLDPESFIEPIDKAGTPSAREAALTDAAFRLADVLGHGATNPNELFEIYTLPRPDPDLIAGLQAAVENSEVGKWLEGLAPHDPQYRALSQAYLDFSRRAVDEARQTIESGESIHVGDTDPRVPRIAEVLRGNGYLDNATVAEPGTDPALFTQQISDGIKRMQEDFGITPDGVVGPNALAMLNTGSRERARVLAVNLERLRWLQRDAPPTRIDVNIAAATLAYYRDGKLRDERKVVDGQPGWETPQLDAPMFRLVANPTWTVPKSIEREEIGSSAAYLRRHNMVRRNGWVVQLPGPDNALGQVKFDLKDDYAIYLHDTPAKALFERNERHFSHGCVRVDRALEFAQLIAGDEGISQEYQQAQASGKRTFVNLPQSIPVRLLYLTAFTDSAGKVRFRTDSYGWDDRIAQKLGYEPRKRRILRTHISDIGP